MPSTMGNRKVNLTRIYHFSASHRLNSPFLDEDENRRIYGKCGHKAGHGHNYLLHVTVRGEVDPVTGMVADTADLDEIVKREVLDSLDHRNLNIELKEAEILTSEVLIACLWERLKPHFDDPELYRIEIEETEKNRFEYYGR